MNTAPQTPPRPKHPSSRHTPRKRWRRSRNDCGSCPRGHSRFGSANFDQSTPSSGGECSDVDNFAAALREGHARGDIRRDLREHEQQDDCDDDTQCCCHGPGTSTASATPAGAISLSPLCRRPSALKSLAVMSSHVRKRPEAVNLRFEEEVGMIEWLRDAQEAHRSKQPRHRRSDTAYIALYRRSASGRECRWTHVSRQCGVTRY
jgi:hypothetical protein